jgi:crossover junction endodeoxyribonuclease RusA
VPDGPLSVSLTFFRPDRRSYDRDNLLARMKAGLDGMCDSLGIDDKRFSVITIRVSDVVVKGGSVYVAVSKDNQKKHEEDLRPVR